MRTKRPPAEQGTKGLPAKRPSLGIHNYVHKNVSYQARHIDCKQNEPAYSPRKLVVSIDASLFPSLPVGVSEPIGDHLATAISNTIAGLFPQPYFAVLLLGLFRFRRQPHTASIDHCFRLAP